jgi:hypothetical protein
MTKEELLLLLRESQLPETCITDQYVEDMLKQTDAEIQAEIADITSFWDQQHAQHRWRTR